MEKYTIFMGQKNQYSEDEYYPKESIDSMPSLSSYQWYFHRTRTNNFTICIETQKTPKSQSNLEKEEWSWKNEPA